MLCEFFCLTLIASKFRHKIEGKPMCHVVLHNGLHSTIARMTSFFVPCEDEGTLIVIGRRGVNCTLTMVVDG